MHTEHLAWGLQMTVIGMGLVFAMLGILWLLLTVILALDKPDEEEEESSAASASEESEEAAEPASAGLPADLVAAITVATIKHKAALQGGGSPIVRTTWPGSQQSNWVVAGRSRQTNTWTPRGK